MANEMTGLTNLKCGPCSGAGGKLAETEVKQYAGQVPLWSVSDGVRIEREFKFADFKAALEFVNRVGELAELEQHHPDIHLAYGKVRVELWTHKVGGLTVNDFILAAKIDRI